MLGNEREREREFRHHKYSQIAKEWEGDSYHCYIQQELCSLICYFSLGGGGDGGVAQSDISSSGANTVPETRITLNLQPSRHS